MVTIKILRTSSYIMYNFKDGDRVCNMRYSTSITYAYASSIRDILVKEGVIDVIDKGVLRKTYRMTDKGKLIQSKLSDIIKILSKNNINGGDKNGIV